MRKSLVVLGSLCILLQKVWAGEITPPPGPVTSTMKPLDQVEPRTAITALPFAIDKAGSYYLAGSLTMPGQFGDGITVNASNVTIDLCGFTLAGAGVGGESYGAAIVCPASNSDITVRDGIITLWPTAGVYFASDVRSRVERVKVTQCQGRGITVGTDSTVLNCEVHNNGGIGIFATGSRIEGCVSDYNATGIECDSDGMVLNNICSHNTADGIYVGHDSIVRGNVCTSNVTGIRHFSGMGTIIEGNTASYGTDGIIAYGAVVRGNTCTYPTAHGIYVTLHFSVVENNVVIGSQVGIGVATGNGVGAYFAGNRASQNSTANYDLHGSPEGTGSAANIAY